MVMLLEGGLVMAMVVLIVCLFVRSTVHFPIYNDCRLFLTILLRYDSLFFLLGDKSVLGNACSFL